MQKQNTNTTTHEKSIQEVYQVFKYNAFNKWLNDYTAGLDDDQLIDFLEHYYGYDLIGTDSIAPDDYFIEIPEEIVEKAKDKN